MTNAARTNGHLYGKVEHTKSLEMDHRPKCKTQNHKASRVKHNIL